MSDVTELGYLRIGVSDLAAWRTFAADLIGLQAHDDTETGALYLRCDSWHHRIVLEEDGSDDLLAVGLRLPDEKSSALCRKICTRIKSRSRSQMPKRRTAAASSKCCI
jgi:hypothetical protein